MSHELLIENIKTKLPHIKPALLHSIWEIVEQAERRQPTPVANEAIKTQAFVAGGLQFLGGNLPFDPLRDSSLQERAALKRRLKTQNQAWLLLQFEKLKAAWLMVVDRQVLAWGAVARKLSQAGEDFGNLPTHRQVSRSLCQRGTSEH